MRAGLFAAALVSIAAVAAGQNTEFRSSRIAVRFDAQGHRHLSWLPAGDRGILAADSTAAEGLEANGWECRDFPSALKGSQARIDDAELGPALEGIVVSDLNDPARDVRLERRVHVLLPDKFLDVALFQTSYRNLGARPVHIGRADSQRLLLDRKLAQPDAAPYEFASFQGGAYHWGKDYSLLWLTPGFRQSNFLGLDDRTGPEGEGGGMPFVDVWSPEMGVAVVHLEKVPQWAWMPVEVRPDQRVEVSLYERPLSKFKQQEWLTPGETYTTVLSAVIFHRLDFYDALSQYGELLRARGIAIPRTSPPSAYEPYWKSWGFGLNFTQQKILGLLPELKSMGIRIANLDDGWFDWYGDWQVNRAPGKFPGGDPDITEFVRRIHAQGFKTNVWWYPLGVSPESRLAKEHPEFLVQDENGNYPKDDRRVYQLCPAYEPSLRQIQGLVDRFVGKYDFDGVYVDSVGLTAVPPCFNPAHHHRSPLDSFQSLPKVFELIHNTLQRLKPDPYFEVCICAMPHSPYNMPYYQIANASDPVTLAQVRRRVKLEKAIRGPSFCVGDCYQVPLNEWTGASVPESFETAMGTGAQLTTFYAELTPLQRAKWQRWFGEYRRMGLASGEYLNLYDIAFDKPEVHVVRKGKEMFYGIFADYWPRTRRIELRGLDRNVTYEVSDYTNGRSLGTLTGAKPFLNHAFKDSLLLRLTPAW